MVLATLAAAVGVSFALADTSPPVPTITSKPASPTSSTGATFTFTDPQAVTFQCSRDGSAFTTCGSGTSGSISYSSLTAGSHTFKVRAASGSKTSGEASYTWLIDTTAPTTPALNFSGLSTNASYAAATATVYFRPAAGGAFKVGATSSDSESGIKPGNAGYAFSPLAANGFTGSQNGGQMEYTFGSGATQPGSDPTVSATNNAGLSSANASYHLKSDTSAPAGGALTVNGSAATAAGSTSFNNTGSFPINSRTEYAETLSATQSGLASSTLTRQSAPLEALGCGDFGVPTTIAGAPAQNGLAEGCYLYTLTGIDRVGTSISVGTTVIVDKRAPALGLVFPVNGGLYNADGWNRGCLSAICGGATDPTGVAQVEISIQRVANGTYWNGASFTSGQTFVTAPLTNPNRVATGWWYAFPASSFPFDGLYTVSVRATDRAGNRTAAADYAKATFTIDRTPPPAPTITRAPANPTSDRTAQFKYTDSEAGVSFICKLDGGGFTSCNGGTQTYNNLPAGTHTFCVAAVDQAGNGSGQTCFTWNIRQGLVNFSMSGSPLAGDLLYPGGPTVAVNLVFTNPNPVEITVTSVTVTITGTTAAGCNAADFSVARQLNQTVTVPANSTKSLNDLSVPKANWPQLRMADNGNQNACRAATVRLSFSGTAQG